MNAIELITIERQEQIEKHGRRIIDDVAQNSNGELLTAATILIGKVGGIPFPKNWDENICEKMNSKPLKEKLVIAAALLAAEIDRIIALEVSAPISSN